MTENSWPEKIQKSSHHTMSQSSSGRAGHQGQIWHDSKRKGTAFTQGAVDRVSKSRSFKAVRSLMHLRLAFANLPILDTSLAFRYLSSLLLPAVPSPNVHLLQVLPYKDTRSDYIGSMCYSTCYPSSTRNISNNFVLKSGHIPRSWGLGILVNLDSAHSSCE